MSEIVGRLRTLSELEPGWYANVGRKTGEQCCAAMREAADRIDALEAALAAPAEVGAVGPQEVR